MKNRILTFLVLCFVWNAQAQLKVPISEAQAQAEQMRISREREELGLQYATQEAECYNRFAVNDCLREVRAHKRVSMEMLRHQEINLNDAKRRTTELDRTRQVQEKTSPTTLKQAAESRNLAQIQHKERLDRAQQKKNDDSKRDMPAGAADNQHPRAVLSPAERGSTQAQQTFEEKQRSANERKAQRDKSLAEKKNKPVRPLPSNP
jgi:hypothetical protein